MSVESMSVVDQIDCLQPMISTELCIHQFMHKHEILGSWDRSIERWHHNLTVLNERILH